MAVHQPGTWIISRIGNNKPATSRKESNIATWRIREFELSKISVYRELTGACTKNIHVMPVEMDWMSNWRGVRGLLDHPVCPLCRSRDLNEIVGLGITCVLLGNILDSRLSWIDYHTCSIDCPEYNILPI